MQYLVNVIDTAAATGTDEEMAAIDVFNAGLQERGQLVFAGGLGAPAAATTIDDRAGAGLITEGPFAELAEWVSGFWIIEAPDHDTALALAAAGSRACNRKVELRPFL